MINDFSVNSNFSYGGAVGEVKDLFYWVKKGNLPLTEQLLKNGAKVNCLDKRNCTPLHYASLLKNSEMSELLKKYGADTTIRSDTGATANDIYHFIVGVKKLGHSNTLLLNEVRQPVSSKDYYELTKTKYVTEQLVKRDVIIQELAQSCPESLDLLFIPEIEKKYLAKCDKNEEKFIFKKVAVDDLGNPLLSDPGFGLFADRDYLPGEILCEYLGKVDRKSACSIYSQSLTIFAGIDTLSYSNESNCINDGFPNVALIPLTNCRGRQNRLAVVSIENIKKGDQICLNYGFHQTKFSPYVELRPLALKNFLSQNENLDHLIDSLGFILKKKVEYNFKNFCLIEKIRYIYSTPLVCFNLIATGVIKEGLLFETNYKYFFEHILVPKSFENDLRDVINLGFNAYEYSQVEELQLDQEENFITKTVRHFASVGYSHFSCDNFFDRLYLKYPEKIKRKIRVFEDKDWVKGRIDIKGIGQILTDKDVGKEFVRTCPPCLDWTFVPSLPTVEKAKKNAIKLKNINDKHLFFETNDPFGKFPKDSCNDGNWIELSKYIKFIGNELHLYRDAPRNSREVNEAYYENQNWLKQAPKKLFNYPWHYFINFPFEKVRDSDILIDESKIKEAKSVLGVPANINDLSKIKKYYHQLALQFHPDKNTAGELKFKEIKTAYETILEEFNIEKSCFELSDNFDEIFTHAINRHKKLQDQLINKSEEFQLKTWLAFNDQLSQMKLPEKKDEELEWVFNNFVKSCNEECFFLKVKKHLQEMDEKIYEIFKLNNPKDVLTGLNTILVSIKAMDLEYDLENDNSKWEVTKNDYFLKVNLMILDHRIALERAIAENYILIHKNHKALEVRKNIVKYFDKKFIKTHEIVKDTLDSRLRMENEFKQRRENAKVESEQGKKSDDNENSKWKKALEVVEDERVKKKEKANPQITQESPGIEMLYRSIKKNMAFFD